MISLPVARITIKFFIICISYYRNASQMKLLEKSFLSQANQQLTDIPNTTANQSTQVDAGRTQMSYSKNPLSNNYRESNVLKRIEILVKYQFHLNNKGENYLKNDNKSLIKKNIQDFLQLQKDINSIKNPLNLTNFSYLSSQITNGQTFDVENPVMTRRSFSGHINQVVLKDVMAFEGSSQNIEELKIEENRFKQILSLQKFLDYVLKEFYFEEVFLVKFLGLTRKQYYEKVRILQGKYCFQINFYIISDNRLYQLKYNQINTGEDCGYQNKDEFFQFKEDFPQLKHSFQICPIINVSLETLGNIKKDSVTYYQITLRKKFVNSSISLPLQSKPLRYTDFSNFYKQFQEDIFPIRLPDFPPKSILNDKETMYQRKQMLQKFLTIIYNENIYFSETLFRFQNCFKDFMIEKAQNITNDLQQYFVSLQGKYLNSSKQFLFKFSPKSSSRKTFFIVKRFKDIINLHKDIELYNSNLVQYLIKQDPQLQEEKNLQKEIKKPINLPYKPKNINDCAPYLQDLLDCNLYHKSVSFRQFLFGFEYLEELLNDNANSSKCYSKRQSFDSDLNL